MGQVMGKVIIPHTSLITMMSIQSSLCVPLKSQDGLQTVCRSASRNISRFWRVRKKGLGQNCTLTLMAASTK